MVKNFIQGLPARRKGPRFQVPVWLTTELFLPYLTEISFCSKSSLPRTPKVFPPRLGVASESDASGSWWPLRSRSCCFSCTEACKHLEEASRAFCTCVNSITIPLGKGAWVFSPQRLPPMCPQVTSAKPSLRCSLGGFWSPADKNPKD